VFEVAFQFEQRQRSAQAMSLMPPSERSLALSFEIRMPEARGMLNVAFPAMASNTLLRKLSVQFSYFKVAGASAYADLLRAQMLESLFEVELQLPPSQVPAKELVGLEPGQVLVLDQQVHQPAVLRVAEQDMFLAHPVACGAMRGGKIQQVLSMNSAVRKETA
jgi:flagellar motor switch protein FliM